MAKKLIAKKTIQIDAQPDEIWKIITDNDSVTSYMLGMIPVTDWKEGSSINWIGRQGGGENDMAKGRILELKPDEILRYSFFFLGYGHADVPEHYQTITLELERSTPRQTILKAQQGDFTVFEEGETYVKTRQ